MAVTDSEGFVGKQQMMAQAGFLLALRPGSAAWTASRLSTVRDKKFVYSKY
jgi:hypothetical protein